MAASLDATYNHLKRKLRAKSKQTQEKKQDMDRYTVSLTSMET